MNIESSTTANVKKPVTLCKFNKSKESWTRSVSSCEIWDNCKKYIFIYYNGKERDEKFLDLPSFQIGAEMWFCPSFKFRGNTFCSFFALSCRQTTKQTNRCGHLLPEVLQTTFSPSFHAPLCTDPPPQGRFQKEEPAFYATDFDANSAEALNISPENRNSKLFSITIHLIITSNELLSTRFPCCVTAKNIYSTDPRLIILPHLGNGPWTMQSSSWFPL